MNIAVELYEQHMNSTFPLFMLASIGSKTFYNALFLIQMSEPLLHRLKCCSPTSQAVLLALARRTH